MQEIDRKEYIKRYEKRLERFGYSPLTLGWGKNGRQDIRFNVLARSILENPGSRVLDVGCGFADLYTFLKKKGWHGHYCGIDFVPGLLKVARQRHPNIELLELDISSDTIDLGTFDYSVGSGIFNAKLLAEDNFEHIQSTLNIMFNLSKIAVCVDFMSTYVDFTHPLAWHTDPEWVFRIAKKMSRRIELRHDYMPYEFAVFIYKDDIITSQNIFRGHYNNL